MSAHYPIVGAGFRPPAKVILDHLPLGAKLWLRREPNNEHDANAIQVLVKPDDIPEASHDELSLQAAGFGFSLEDLLNPDDGFWHLGYVPAKFAIDLAPKLDQVIYQNLPEDQSATVFPGVFTMTSKSKPAVLPVDTQFHRYDGLD